MAYKGTHKTVDGRRSFDHIAEHLYRELAKLKLQPLPVPSAGDYFIPNPSAADHEPAAYFVHLRQFFPPESKQSTRIICATKAVVDFQVKLDFHAYHFDIWTGYTKSIFASADTMLHNIERLAREATAKPETIANKRAQYAAVQGSLHELAQAVGTGSFKRKVTAFDGATINRMRSLGDKAMSAVVNARDKNHGLKDLTDTGRELRAGLNTMVAVARGSGSHNRFHYDVDDASCCYTVLMILSELTEPWDPSYGHFVIPQLGVDVQVMPGDVLLFRSDILLHRATSTEGAERWVYTFFTSQRTLDVMRQEFEGEGEFIDYLQNM